ncbi:GNAT family N-acetyltransferase [Saccharothrix coeruleofusca]|uniref:N-acetyltransferase domain-containing protein n=1 Tax=Saccharothrix coeruleofusca TaxID=33919 RepID=A0A918EDE4_9PSEU|nr:GNAT family N-acetyltransferase [Saccharothrix coeruleofusca]MBP2338151.1 GNAT superfamily N-acetyltransferase [Saccharothrix coeruleofusca]GGP50432.1 hypothetical protein GCM10010185_23340 [Saccharothrix coeruleofusca]
MVELRVLDRATAGDAVDAVFDGLSPRSRYLRFHAPVPRLTATMRERLADVDGRDRAALVARSGRRAIGIARLSATGGGSAELAVAVVDRWQRRGVGTRLITALGELAVRLRHTELHATVLPENLAVLSLARRAFSGVLLTAEEDAITLRYSLEPTLTHEELVAALRW